MNRILLDTHTFIWFVSNDIHLPNAVREQIEFTNVVFFSIASLWEMAIKLSIGKLPLQGAFEDIESLMATIGIEILPISFADTVQYRHLALYHRDPFDRILVAQAIHHSLPLISRNVAFDAYPIQRVWA